ncbi:MAG: tetratricopeptide repeat protein [Pseudomonadota bacterium]
MSTSQPHQIFLSCVTDEFGPHRKLLKDDLSLPRVTVQVQEGLVQGEGKLLQTLDTYIRDYCDAMIHLLGRESGQSVKADEVRWLLDTYGDFSERFSFLTEELAALPPTLPYTQMEVWLALYHRKRCHIYRPSSLDERPLPDDHPQQRHWQRLKDLGEHRGRFDDAQHLCRCVLRDLHDFWPADVPAERRPILLPYPSLGTLFKGRNEFLEQLRASLTQASEGATAIVGKAVHGLGGVGKTRLAVEYAWQHKDDYSAVLFVTADSPGNLRRDLAALAGPLVLDLPAQTATEEAVRVAAALQWLHDHPGWFLILDNVDTEEAASHIEDLLSRLHGGHVLITSRLARWGDYVKPLELDVLSTESAKSFLLERTAPQSGGRGRKSLPNDEVLASDLAKDLDGLALALEQAGAYIVARRISLADYRRRWKAHDTQVQSWHREREMKYPRSVAVTWQTTLEQLDAGEVALMNLLAWFAPEPIPLFVLGLSSPSLGFNPEENAEDAKETKAIEAIWRDGVTWLPKAELPPGGSADGEQKDNATQDGRTTLREALATLADFSMVRWDVDAETVTVHRVVQEILRTRQQSLTESAATEWLTLALRILDQAQPSGSPQDVRTWPRWEPLSAHAAFATEEADRRQIGEPTSRLMNALGQLLNAKALYSEAELLFRRALAIDEQAYGPEHPTVAIRLDNLAALLQATNRPAEAEPLYRRMAAILLRFQQRTGHEHPNMQTALENYLCLLTAMDVSQDEIEGQVLSAMQTKGSLGPINPEVERLLGPAQPVKAVLEALDTQYKKENKPPVWFLPRDEPIAPHLDELLGPADEENASK